MPFHRATDQVRLAVGRYGGLTDQESNGATTVDVGQGADVTWDVFADPEGNEFCVLSSRDD
jgi:Glyoxalase-like domain